MRLEKHCRLMSQLIKAQHQLLGLAMCIFIVKTYYLLLIKLDDGMNVDWVTSALLNKWLNDSFVFCFCLLLGFFGRWVGGRVAVVQCKNNVLVTWHARWYVFPNCLD